MDSFTSALPPAWPAPGDAYYAFPPSDCVRWRRRSRSFSLPRRKSVISQIMDGEEMALLQVRWVDGWWVIIGPIDSFAHIEPMKNE